VARPTPGRGIDLTGQTVVTVVGSHGRVDDGSILEARLVAPTSFSCAATRCVATEAGLGARVVDLAGARADVVRAGTAIFDAPGPVTMIDDDAFAFPSGVSVRSFAFGAPSDVLASGSEEACNDC